MRDDGWRTLAGSEAKKSNKSLVAGVWRRTVVNARRSYAESGRIELSWSYNFPRLAALNRDAPDLAGVLLQVVEDRLAIRGFL